MPLTCIGRSSEVLLGAMIGSCSWKVQVMRSIVATVTMGFRVSVRLVLSYVKALQGLGMLDVSVKL